MKTKLEKVLKEIKDDYLNKRSRGEETTAYDFLKFKAKFIKIISRYKKEIAKKSEVIQNQTEELTRLRLEVYLYKAKLRDIRKKLDYHDVKFEGWDMYQLSEGYAKLFNKLPAKFNKKQIELLGISEIGADNDELGTMLWQCENLYLISKKADGSYIKLLDAVPSDLNEIDYIRDRVSLVQN
ncbi:hypothetical protein [Roseivirga seohaensis]|uniref:hypothetical protein n=1 Tax=Roseivirga seohaensis TaxID=1914963 RepID=UPI003BA8A7DB